MSLVARVRAGRCGARVLAMLALAGLAVGVGACGGGGGGGGGGTPNQPVTVTGRVVSVETGQPPTAPATVVMAGQTKTTLADGTFSFSNVPSNTTSAMVTATMEMARTFPLVLTAGQANALGDVFVSNSGYTATVTGQVVTQVNGVTQPVSGATVLIGNVQTTSDASGMFTLNNLPVGLGTAAGFAGKITATGYDDKPITADVLQFPLVTGSNNIGAVPISKSTAGTVPVPPYTVKGTVNVGGKPATGITVNISPGGGSTGTTQTDSTGTYYFWVVPGTYTLTVLNGSQTQTVNVTVVSTNTPVTVSAVNF